MQYLNPAVCACYLLIQTDYWPHKTVHTLHKPQKHINHKQIKYNELRSSAGTVT